MSIENEAVALFEEGNPVPDLEALEPATVDAAAYLVTLERRSSAMTQLETRERQDAERRRRNRALIIGLAGAAVIALVVVLSLLQGDTPPIVEEPDPVPTTAPVPEPVPTTTPAPDSVPTTTLGQDVSDLQGFTGNEPAGTYRPMIFQPGFAFTLEREGWRAGYGAGSHFWLISPENTTIEWEQPTIFFTSPGPSTTSSAETVDDVVSWIENHPGLEDVTVSSTDAEIGGREALVLSGVGAADSTVPLWGDGDQARWGVLDNHIYTFYVLEVEGAPLVVTLDYLNSSQAGLLEPEVEEILNSIRWQGQD